MRKLIPVEEAKQLFTEAQDWSVWRWLTDKKRARRAADAANQALDDLDREVKSGWAAALTAAYNDKLNGAGKRKTSHSLDQALQSAVERCRTADEEAWACRMEAEDMFEEAERHLSASMARDGARKAIESWVLKESAIRKSETLLRRGVAQKA